MWISRSKATSLIRTSRPRWRCENACLAIFVRFQEHLVLKLIVLCAFAFFWVLNYSHLVRKPFSFGFIVCQIILNLYVTHGLKFAIQDGIASWKLVVWPGWEFFLRYCFPLPSIKLVFEKSICPRNLSGKNLSQIDAIEEVFEHVEHIGATDDEKFGLIFL